MGKTRNIGLLALVQVLAMSLWFVSAAILPGMVAEAGLSAGRGAALSSAVQIGFVIGALCLAFSGAADRYDPRVVLGLSALAATIFNLLLLVTPIGGGAQIALRAATGAALAGVYPVGMKIAVGWSTRSRGLLVGFLVGAVSVGSAMPYLLAYVAPQDWRSTVVMASVFAGAAAVIIGFVRLGPEHKRAPDFRPSYLRLAWSDLKVRYAYIGYLGHMWELYAFWAWIAAALTVAFSQELGPRAPPTANAVTFAAIVLGGLMCAPAGWVADRVGKARVAAAAMAISAAAAIGSAAAFHGPVWLIVLLVLIWGAAVIPDSAQFSALVADAAPPEAAGSLMAFQTALGFALTAVTVQAVPFVVAMLGWPATLMIMALGPAVGIRAMLRLMNMA